MNQETKPSIREMLADLLVRLARKLSPVLPALYTPDHRLRYETTVDAILNQTDKGQTTFLYMLVGRIGEKKRKLLLKYIVNYNEQAPRWLDKSRGSKDPKQNLTESKQTTESTNSTES